MKRIQILTIITLLFVPLVVQSQSTKQKLRRLILLSEQMQRLSSQAVDYMNNCDSLFTRDECTQLAYNRIDTALKLSVRFNRIAESLRVNHFPQTRSTQRSWELEDKIYDIKNLSSQAIDEFEGCERYFKKYFAVKSRGSYYSKESYSQIIYQKMMFASEKVKFSNDISIEIYQMFYQ
ncbi:MAG: hypothetical protein K9I94_07550 [Bacteroidales bacterium]|nr:hypothetical protein [Bacteroidales bacterium]